MKLDSMVPALIVVFLILVAILAFVYNPVQEGFEPYSDAALANFLATNSHALALIQESRNMAAKGCIVVSGVTTRVGPAANSEVCQILGQKYTQTASAHAGPMEAAAKAKFGSVPSNLEAAVAIAIGAPSWPPQMAIPAGNPALQQSILQFLATNPDGAEMIRLQRHEVQNGCSSFASGTRQAGPNRDTPDCAAKVSATNTVIEQRQAAFANAFFAKFGPPTPQLIQELVKATAAAANDLELAAPVSAVAPSVMAVPPPGPGAPLSMSAAPTVGTEGTMISTPAAPMSMSPAAPVSIVPESLKPETMLGPATPLMGTPAPFTANSSHAPATIVIPEDTPPGTYLLRAVT
jgi:hypothetical protein